MNIQWSANLGESGLWTSPLIKSEKLIPGNCHVCVSCPSSVGVDKTCEIQASLTNTKLSQNAPARFFVEIHSSSEDVMLAGPVSFRTSPLAQCEVFEFSLAVVILRAGSHTIRIDVFDETLKGSIDRSNCLETKEVPLPS